MDNFLIFTIDTWAVTLDSKNHFDIDSLGMQLDMGVTLDIANKSSLNILADDYIPKIGDKLYFLPGVNIPRVKLKNLILDYNIKIVKDLKDATIVFGSRHSASKMMTNTWYYTIKTEDFKVCYQALRPHLDAKTVDNIDTALEFYTGEHLYSTDWPTVNRICETNLAVYQGLIQNPGAVAESNRASRYLEIIGEEYYKILEELENKVILNDGSLVDKLNGDEAIVINLEVYAQLSQMFESTDNENHVLAMEIMANSNYKESLLYMHILFKEYHHKIANSHTKNHVNFKSLLAYLGKDVFNLHSNLNIIIKSLLEKQVITEEMLNILMDKYSEEILRGGDQTFFKVKNITICEEVLLTINSNYEYTIRPEFVPAIIADPVVVENATPKPENFQWL